MRARTHTDQSQSHFGSTEKRLHTKYGPGCTRTVAFKMRSMVSVVFCRIFIVLRYDVMWIGDGNSNVSPL